MTFLLRPVSGHSGANANNVMKIEPSPCFVVKSKILQPNKTSLKKDAKIFINICHNEEIPLPEIDFNPSIVYPLIVNNQWEVPIVTSSIREDSDKKGNLCYVVDCCINTKCVSWIQQDLQLREIVIEWCLESCELREQIEISRDHISFPKLKKKGETIPPLEILKDDLKEDYRETIDEMVKRESKDPISIIEMKRDLIAEEEEGIESDTGLPPLIPVDKVTQHKPLIEEIEDLSLHEVKKPKIISQSEQLKYEVTMGKTNGSSEFFLRVEVTSKIDSSLDYEVKYDPKTNTLLIKNTNTKVYPEKKLEIPLPNVFSDAPKLKCFFVKPERKLVLFL